MRRLALVLLGLLGTLVHAEEVWTLRTGPTVVESIPLDPVQLVSAWRMHYGDGDDSVWLYATQSPHFFAPRSLDVVKASPTPWTVVAFFPPAWSSQSRSAWLALWLAEFRTLASLPEPGFPIVVPAVLRKG